MEAQKIIIDSREPEDIVELVKKLNYPVEVQQLEVGDILFGNILIERKEISDLVNSVRDTRLWHQLYSMKLQEGYKRFLIVIGSVQDTVHPGITDFYAYSQYVKNLLLSVQIVSCLSYDVYFLQCNDRMEFLELLKLLIQRSSKVEGLKPLKRKKRSIDDAVVEMIGCIPNIGRRIASELSNMYSLSELCSLSQKELEDLKIDNRRLGKKGESIYKMLHYKKGNGDEVNASQKRS